jgi:peptidoglycan/xylan/chitin deacetylase (PgdA/CDA1 family)
VEDTLILTYHSLDESGSVISVAPGVFREHVRFLVEAGIPILPLEKVREAPGGVAITFDDGFRNFYEHAAPAFAEFRVPATVFVVTGYCGKDNGWPSQPATVPRLQLMGWHELEEVARFGVRLGAHTVTHPRLNALSEREAEREIRESRQALEDRTGRRVDTFAYPYGLSCAATRRLAARHYRFACGVELGAVKKESDPLNLPRIDCYYFRSGGFWFRNIRSRAGKGYLAARSLLRRARALTAR